MNGTTEIPITDRSKSITTPTAAAAATPAGVTGDFSLYSPSTVSASRPSVMRDTNMTRDLEAKCIHAMTFLLDGLPLQPNTLGNFVGTEENYLQVKSRMFNRYFTYFHQVLQECIGLIADNRVKSFPKRPQQQTVPTPTPTVPPPGTRGGSGGSAGSAGGDLSAVRQSPTYQTGTSPHSSHSISPSAFPRYLLVFFFLTSLLFVLR